MLPSQRTGQWLKRLGFKVGTVERFVKFPGMEHGIRQDLFGFIDLIAMHPKYGIVAVQATVGAAHAAHVDKIEAEPNALFWTRCGAVIWLVSWRKGGERGKRKLWTMRIEEFYVAKDGRMFRHEIEQDRLPQGLRA